MEFLTLQSFPQVANNELLVFKSMQNTSLPSSSWNEEIDFPFDVFQWWTFPSVFAVIKTDLLLDPFSPPFHLKAVVGNLKWEIDLSTDPVSKTKGEVLSTNKKMHNQFTLIRIIYLCCSVTTPYSYILIIGIEPDHRYFAINFKVIFYGQAIIRIMSPSIILEKLTLIWFYISSPNL